MRRTLFTIVLSLLACVVLGQTYYYRYWIDNNVSGAVTGSASGEKQFTVSLSSVGNGLHAIHVQACNNAGVWSSVRTRYFMKEQQMAAVSARYWIDNDMTTLHNSVATNGVINLDIANLGNGLHAVHYQKIATDGTPSSVRTRYFMKDGQNQTCSSARYWIDNDMTTLHSNVATSGIIELDITKLSVGLHAVHYQTIASDGTPSAVRTRYFLVDRVQPGNFTASISIDSGEATNYALTGEDIVIEIGELAKGEHTLYVTLTDNEGNNYGTKDHTFTVYRAEAQTLALETLPQMTYGDKTYELPEQTTEGLALTWTSDNEAVATISGNVLTITGAGTATITATQAGNEMNLPLSREFTLTVAKAMLTITADDCSKQEGDENPELTVSYSGFVNGDDATSLTTQPTVTTTATIDSPVGTYPITVSGAEASNYEFTYVDGTLTVTEKPIVLEPTDISQLSDALYINAFEGRIGDDVNIEVRLKNAENATSYGFELVLPEGMSIPVESDGSFDDQVTLSTRHKGHNITTNKLSATTYKIGVISMSSKSLTDNDGVVITIKAHVADNMSVGDYAVWIENPLLVYSDGTKPAIQPTMTVVTIEDYIKGDVDGDGVVDLADAVVIINHYVGKPVNTFIGKAADVDGDGVVDLADAVRVINYYVGKVESLSRRPVYDGLEPQ